MYEFQDFWVDYDKMVGKDKCLTKWMLLNPQEHERIKIHIPGFVSRQRNKQYRPNPLSYLNGKMWLDENVGEKEEERLYKFRDKRTISDYEAKPYPRSKGIAHMREKLKRNYENGTPIKDWGGVYTALLKDKCSMMIPGGTRKGIANKCLEEKNRVRNRFEEQYNGSLESDIRDAELKFFLDQCRENSRNISLEI